jgi:hypothetical protein
MAHHVRAIAQLLVVVVVVVVAHHDRFHASAFTTTVENSPRNGYIYFAVNLAVVLVSVLFQSQFLIILGTDSRRLHAAFCVAGSSWPPVLTRRA